MIFMLFTLCDVYDYVYVCDSMTLQYDGNVHFHPIPQHPGLTSIWRTSSCQHRSHPRGQRPFPAALGEDPFQATSIHKPSCWSTKHLPWLSSNILHIYHIMSYHIISCHIISVADWHLKDRLRWKMLSSIVVKHQLARHLISSPRDPAHCMCHLWWMSLDDDHYCWMFINGDECC